MRLALCALCVAAGVIATVTSRRDDVLSFAGRSDGGGAVLLLAGGSLAIATLVAVRRGSELLPALLAGTGTLWFVSEWDSQFAPSDLVFTAGLVLAPAWPAVLAWTLLAFPTGRLHSVTARVVVASTLLAAVVLQGLLPTMWFDPAAAGCTHCPSNLLLVAGSHRGLDVAQQGMVLTAAGLVAALVIGGARVKRRHDGQRSVAAWLWVGALLALGATAVTLLLGLDRGFVGSGETEYRLWWVQASGLAVVAAALWLERSAVSRTRARLARVVVQYGESAASHRLRDALARALRDPMLEIAYPVGDGRWADSDGKPVEVPDVDDPRRTSLVQGRETIGIILHKATTPADSATVTRLVEAARLGLHHEALQSQLRFRERELRASRRRLVEASDEARHGLERDLHDGAQQQIIGILMGLNLIQRVPDLDAATTAHLRDAVEKVRLATESLRSVANRLHPAVLSDEGLVPALEALTDADGGPVSIDEAPCERVPGPAERTAYRLIAAVAEHGAINVRAHRDRDVLNLDIRAPAAPANMLELQDRVSAFDGKLLVTEEPVGVRLRAEIPCA